MIRVAVRTSGGVTLLKGTTVFSRLGLRSTYFRLLQVSLSAPNQLVRGRRFTLRGRLWPKPKSRWHLQIKRTGGTWQNAVIAIRLDSRGHFAIARRPLHDISYRIARKGAFSPVRHVDVE